MKVAERKLRKERTKVFEKRNWSGKNKMKTQTNLLNVVHIPIKVEVDQKKKKNVKKEWTEIPTEMKDWNGLEEFFT